MLYKTFDPFRDLASASRTFDYDVVRTEDGVTLHIDIPGIDPATVELTVDGRSLRLDAQRSTQLPENAELVANRRRPSSASQTFQLGELLDSERLSADYEFGVLTVTVPVAESAKPRKVAVGVGVGGAQSIDANSSAD